MALPHARPVRDLEQNGVGDGMMPSVGSRTSIASKGTLMKLTLARDRLQHVLLALCGSHCTSTHVPRWPEGQGDSESLGMSPKGSGGTQVKHSKLRSWPTTSAIACHSAADYSTYHPPPMATTVLRLVYRGDPKIKNWLAPTSKPGHNVLPEGGVGTQVKHSSFHRRSMTSAIICCQANRRSVWCRIWIPASSSHASIKYLEIKKLNINKTVCPGTDLWRNVLVQE